MVVLGVVPAASENGLSLSTARTAGQPATIPLGFIIGGSIIVLGNVFAAFSTLTSYIGFGISLKDSYGDLANKKQRLVSELALTGLVVVPPLMLALLHPGAFLHTLDIAVRIRSIIGSRSKQPMPFVVWHHWFLVAATTFLEPLPLTCA